MKKEENGENDILSNSKKSKSAKGQCERIMVKKRKSISILCLLLFILVILLLLGTSIYISTKLLVKSKPRDFRLPKTIIPNHYTLEIQPYLIPGNFIFKGSVEINFYCKQRTDVIIFHAKNLSIDHQSIRIQNQKGKNIELLKIEYEENVNLVILTLMDKLSLDDYNLFMNFEGNLDRPAKGFYSYSYEDENNITNYAAITQFEPISAREAFPCFDEPELKATFDITIIRWRNMTSLSNMPKVETVSRGRHWQADIFETSKKMSTYLVAFVVGNFESKQKGKISIWTDSKNIQYVDYALEVADKALSYYENLLGMPYNMTKLDIVSVEKLDTRGMENWGLIICKDYYVLFNEEKDSMYRKVQATIILLHEIAHQWIGNLVTMKWWNDIWLKEGITKYVDQMAYDAFYEDFNVTKDNITVFYDDYNVFVDKSISKNIKKLEDINEIFDFSVYFMGSNVIRLAHFILGEPFWKGLTSYLKENVYGSVEEPTLWKYFTEVQHPMQRSQLNISNILSTWTHLKGFPLLTVERDYENHSVNLSQVAFQKNYDTTVRKDLWPIPISYTTGESRDWRPIIKYWMNTKNATINITKNNDDWIIINGETIMYYMVNYDETNWNLLAKQLRKDHTVFPFSYRHKILHDAIALFKENYTTLETLLDLYLYTPYEEELAALSFDQFLLILIKLSEIIEFTSDEIAWEDFIKYLFEPFYKRLGWDYGDKTEDMYTSSFRQITILVLCRRKYMPCVNIALTKFKNWKEESNGTDIPYPIKRAILCTGIEYGTADEWNDLFNEYVENNDRLLISALSCSRNRTLITKLLQRLLIKPEEKYFNFIIDEVLHNPHMWLEVFYFFNDHFKELAEDDRKFANILEAFDGLKYSPIKFNQVLATAKQYIKVLNKAKADKYRQLLIVDKRLKEQTDWLQSSIKRWLRNKPWNKIKKS